MANFLSKDSLLPIAIAGIAGAGAIYLLQNMKPHGNFKYNFGLGANFGFGGPKGGKFGKGKGRGYMRHDGDHQAYTALGYDYSTDEYNLSEVWDTRDKTWLNDNVLYNKVNYIPYTPVSDFNPENMSFSAGYSKCGDVDAPRPRLEHWLDSM